MEPAADAGGTVLAARALTEGTERYDAISWSRPPSGLVRRIHADAGWDALSVSVDVPAARLGPALELVAEVLLRPTFPAHGGGAPARRAPERPAPGAGGPAPPGGAGVRRHDLRACVAVPPSDRRQPRHGRQHSRRIVSDAPTRQRSIHDGQRLSSRATCAASRSSRWPSASSAAGRPPTSARFQGRSRSTTPGRPIGV